MKKIIIMFISCLLLFNFATVRADDLSIESLSAILIDSDSGQVLFEKNSHEMLPPASITKIMTMLITMEEINKGNIKLTDEATISELAADMGGSQLYLEYTEKRSIEDLLKGVAVESANDAAVALSEHIAGDYQLFIQMMNDRASELGMKDTKFQNANGLPAEEHYTSAHDIALMSRELLKYPEIHNYMTIWMTDITVGKNNDKVRTISNTNKLLRRDNRVDGLKTGYTDDAGYCLAATAKEGSMRLVSVILNAPSSNERFDEAMKLLNYGFSQYKKENVVDSNEAMGEIIVNKGDIDKIQLVTKEGYGQLLPKNETKEFEQEINIPDNINAPIKKGDKIGELIVKEKGKEVKKIDLLADQDVEKITFFGLFNKLYKDFLVF
ncbi:D-alanyl-D-alanine carboxypeptidase [Alkalibaculum sp. M08DMB]|uniref:serine-type D-Ala-D-Ala carboxypeptidase n=1 Tax=Alkalibaculum sporogenes TaxID=2655001 RepID=A0A6A7K732_9FIRM|nr:D-alanyl-D-alanine carboxypeptidase family protein [Alkalibaculum sporogenes]MPW25195.1 D-alanyl-D-alanine carboxypeptidase [Alkalibaculum sporogenes]